MQTCSPKNTAKLITNVKLNITEKRKVTEKCKEKEIIYAPQCSTCKVLYAGHTGDHFSEGFSKHHYNIKIRPDNSERREHFHKSHNTAELM